MSTHLVRHFYPLTLSVVIGLVINGTVWSPDIQAAEIETSKAQLAETSPTANTRQPIPVIEEIVINTHPIFDESNPKENNWLFRWVNRLHMDTKKRIIKKELTFKEGDPVDKHLLDESARRLRSKRFIGEASVKLVDDKTEHPGTETDHKNSADSDIKSNTSAADAQPQTVQVDVKEVWTLVPKLTYSRSGGNTHYGYGLHDSNFLGLGKTVKIEHSSTEQRVSDEIVYRDPNFGNQNQLMLGYADNSDGKAQAFSFAKPFISVRTPWSSGINFQDFDREDTLYNAGDEAARFGHNSNYYSVFYGVRLPYSTDNRSHRLLLGYDDNSNEFFNIPGAISPQPFALPYDRNYQVLWLEYQYTNNSFIEASNIQQINRVEDINLGAELRLRLGSVQAEVPELDQATLVQFDYSRAFTLSPTQLLIGSFASSGFYGGSQTTQSLNQLSLSYHWQNFSHGQFYAHAQEIYGKNLFIDTPLELGGDTGLRGYPARFQAGDKLRLLTLEQRFFGEKEWFSLFHMGAAIFYDEGRVWGNSAIPQNYQQTLRSVGMGLRISGTRTGGKDENVHNVTHIDIAYPLDGGPDIDKYQFSVHIKSSF